MTAQESFQHQLEGLYSRTAPGSHRVFQKQPRSELDGEHIYGTHCYDFLLKHILQQRGPRQFNQASYLVHAIGYARDKMDASTSSSEEGEDQV